MINLVSGSALMWRYHRLGELVGGGQFGLTKAVSNELHALVAVHEAIECGHFRGEGRVTGGAVGGVQRPAHRVASRLPTRR